MVFAQVIKSVQYLSNDLTFPLEITPIGKAIVSFLIKISAFKHTS